MTGVQTCALPIYLARETLALRPETRVLNVSGFADLEGISPDIPRLNKPFRQNELAAMVSELLPGGRRDGAKAT